MIMEAIGFTPKFPREIAFTWAPAVFYYNYLMLQEQ